MQGQDVKEVQATEHKGQEDTLKGLLPLSCLSTLTSCVCSDWTVRLVKVIPLHFLRFDRLVQNASQHYFHAQLSGTELILYNIY